MTRLHPKFIQLCPAPPESGLLVIALREDGTVWAHPRQANSLYENWVEIRDNQKPPKGEYEP